MENVPFCEEVQYMAKHPPSLRMPSIALECFSGPLHRRLFLALSQQILSSDFQNGDRLPSTRALAKALGISRNTVVSAYDKLAEDGYTNSKVGSGTHIALTLTGMSRPATKPGGRNEGRSQPHRSSPTVSLSCPECDFSGPRWKRSLSFRGSLIRPPVRDLFVYRFLMAYKDEIGLHRAIVKVVPYCPKWAEYFSQEKELLLKAWCNGSRSFPLNFSKDFPAGFSDSLAASGGEVPGEMNAPG